MLLYYFFHNPGNSVLGFETLVATNFRYGHFAHIKSNTGRFLFGIIFNKCMPCNLINSAKMVAGLRIIVEVYFSHSITMTSFIAPFTF